MAKGEGSRNVRHYLPSRDLGVLHDEHHSGELKSTGEATVCLRLRAALRTVLVLHDHHASSMGNIRRDLRLHLRVGPRLLQSVVDHLAPSPFLTVSLVNMSRVKSGPWMGRLRRADRPLAQQAAQILRRRHGLSRFTGLNIDYSPCGAASRNAAAALNSMLTTSVIPRGTKQQGQRDA